jgi:class 3 adenylate cyclase
VVHRDRVVSKPELCDQVWTGQFISEATLESHMRLVRQAIGDTGRTQHLIQTLYGHGYRFIGVVEEHDAALLAEAVQTTLSVPLPVIESAPEEATATAVAVSPSLEPQARPSALQAAPVVLGADLSTSGYRQLTVLVCHLAEAPALAMRLEPEALHAVLRAYHAACTAVMARFGGYVAQSLGESLVVYFGFPQAHEDDARRAVQAGLALLEALEHGQSEVVSAMVRVGIHTSPVVVVASQSEAQLAALAMGEAPQLAPYLARQAAPETVIVSAATWRLVAGWFVGEPLEAQPLPGLPQPVSVYRVLRASGAQSYLEAVGPERLTPWLAGCPKWPYCRSAGLRPGRDGVRW